jgi:uncharacterized protein YqgQ
MNFVLPLFYDVANLHKKFGINLIMFNLITFPMLN